MTLKIGEIQYQERLQDIESLTIKLHDLQRKLSLKSRTSMENEQSKKDTSKVERKVLEEQVKRSYKI
jgi:hypothetical protein